MFYSELQNGHAVKTPVDNVVFDRECDVLVAGLGTAGALAAVAAAEAGASVVGVERLKMCGGTATGGGVFGYYYGLPGGRFEGIDKVSVELSNKNFVGGNNNRHPYAKSFAIEQAMTAAGAEIIYEAAVVGIYLNDNTICGVKIISESGPVNISCKALVDGSGDGEVSAAAGAEYEIGRDIDGQPQPFSSIRVFATESGHLGLANFDAGYVLPDNADDLTRGLLKANALHRGGIEKFGDRLLWITLPPGPREGRLIKCDYTLEFYDFIKGGRCEDPVVYAHTNFDSHTQDWAFESNIIKDWMVGASLWGYVFNIPLPAEVMFASGLTNLLCPGRNLSVDHDMACAVRMQRCLQKLGETAGIIAAEAALQGKDIREFDRPALIAALKKSGALNSPDELPDDTMETAPEALNEMLKSEAPGVAIWVTSRNLPEYRNMLLEGLQSDDINYSRNCAMALGLGSDDVAIPKLTEIVKDRDPFEPKSSRSHNQRRLFGALHLLGQTGDPDVVDTLIDFLALPDLDMQEFSHTMMALLNLGDGCLNLQSRISDVLTEALGENCKEYKLLLKNSSSTGYRAFVDMTEFMRKVLKDRLNQWGNL